MAKPDHPASYHVTVASFYCFQLPTSAWTISNHACDSRAAGFIVSIKGNRDCLWIPHSSLLRVRGFHFKTTTDNKMFKQLHAHINSNFYLAECRQAGAPEKSCSIRRLHYHLKANSFMQFKRTEATCEINIIFKTFHTVMKELFLFR